MRSMLIVARDFIISFFFDLSDDNVFHIFVRMQSIDGENIKNPIISHAKNLTDL